MRGYNASSPWIFAKSTKGCLCKFIFLLHRNSALSSLDHSKLTPLGNHHIHFQRMAGSKEVAWLSQCQVPNPTGDILLGGCFWVARSRRQIPPSLIFILVRTQQNVFGIGCLNPSARSPEGIYFCLRRKQKHFWDSRAELLLCCSENPPKTTDNIICFQKYKLN